MLASLKVTEQSSVHHPEGDAWIHTIMVVDEAAKCKDKSTDPHAFMWAAMLHDIGKPKTTRNRKGKITAYDHDRVGAELAREFLIVFISDRQFIERVVALVRWHMQILYVVNDLPFKEVQKMKDEVSIKIFHYLVGAIVWEEKIPTNLKKEISLKLFIRKLPMSMKK